MATLTAAQAVSGVNPKSHHVGIQSVYAVVSLSATVSAGDYYRMCKIPNGARITDVIANLKAGTGNDWVASVGLEGSLSDFASATGAATVVRATKNLPYDVSLSDDAAQQFSYATIQVQAVTSGSATGALSLQVFFTLDKT